jgi:hypothetical protein
MRALPLLVLVLCSAPLAGCGAIGGKVNVDEVANEVSRDLQARINRALADARHDVTRVIVYREIRCPGNATIRPGSRLVCRTYGSLLDRSQEQDYYVHVTVLDSKGHVGYTISPPPGYIPPRGATPMPGFTPTGGPNPLSPVRASPTGPAPATSGQRAR